ncbi:hypothetical protein BU180_12615 [Listeria monocytogenes]|nr:hypothetical protein [Listeria monocytogenes]EAE9170062.1 hypothetical protein [Listeria monocytogenes]
MSNEKVEISVDISSKESLTKKTHIVANKITMNIDGWHADGIEGPAVVEIYITPIPEESIPIGYKEQAEMFKRNI